MKKIFIFRIASLILFILGLFLLNSENIISGAFIGVNVQFLDSILSSVLIVSSLIIFMVGESELEKKVILLSAIKKDAGIRRLAEESTRNQRVKGDLDHLIYELSKGHLAGKTKGHLKGTSIYYLRGESGARLYYHLIKGAKEEIIYEIVGKSAKDITQKRVIRKLLELYGR